MEERSGIIDLENPRPGSRIAIDQRGDCTVISLKGAAFAELWPDWLSALMAVALGLAFLFLMIAIIVKGASAGSLVWLFGFAAIGILFAFAPEPMTKLYRQSRSAMFEISRDRLTVAAPGFVFFQRLRWRRECVRAVAAWKGLQIADTNGAITTLCPYHSIKELDSLAALLQQILNVPEELPCRAGELSVRYAGSLWDEPVPGVLSVEPGRMSLRHPLDPEPYLRFRSAATSPWPIHSSILLSESDVNCRVLDDGTMCLRIAPRDARGRFDRGEPQIRVGLLSALLSDGRLTFDAGTTPKRYFLFHEDTSFYLTIWCRDSEALPRALARFWGSQGARGADV
jgi:hypothetical protein